VQLVAIRVVLADDSSVIREAIADVLGLHRDIDLVATAVDQPTLLATVDEHRPDVVVTDIRMPPTGTDEGIRVAEQLYATHPAVGVVVVGDSAGPTIMKRLFAAGRDIRAFVSKERVGQNGQLVAAVRAVYQGA
jgi:DNA-binding NarL/FixJ family response regulator